MSKRSLEVRLGLTLTNIHYVVKYSYKIMEVKVCMAKHTQRQCELIISDRILEKGRPSRAAGTPPPPLEVREFSSGGHAYE